MPSSSARVSTEKPTPYLKQLCKHFGHKLDVTFDDHEGVITLGAGRCDLHAGEPGMLVLEAHAETDDDLATVQHVIGSHLERFGRRDDLVVTWSASAASG